MSVFGKYADFYDSLYQDKDYIGECDAIEEIFEKYSKKRISSILDLGCGTGNHAFILHIRGYKVIGVDRSGVMLANAERKLSKLVNKKNIKFEKGDLRSWKSSEKFDAVIMMFAVLGYQLENKDVLQALSTVREHLKSGGLFIFDVWYGPAVLIQKPSKRNKTINTSDGKILRTASADIDTTRQICTVHYTTSHIKNKHKSLNIKEDHQMRYFFPQELALFLKTSGLGLIRLGSFPQWRNIPNVNTWNIFGIAKVI